MIVRPIKSGLGILKPKITCAKNRQRVKAKRTIDDQQSVEPKSDISNLIKI